MRYLRCRLTFAEDAIHPVHAAMASDDAPSRDLLWQWSRADDADVFLYSIEGETAAYEAALAETPSVVEYESTGSGDGRQYVYVHQESRAVGRRLRRPSARDVRETSSRTAARFRFRRTHENRRTVQLNGWEMNNRVASARTGRVGSLPAPAGNPPVNGRGRAPTAPHASVGVYVTPRITHG